ncbi:uncharacterized protein LOC131427474 isoform X2 [Malaya genurostris]|nr:uncharacterized protein LOC131427474 isoform X2 [Malaya genurostris]
MEGKTEIRSKPILSPTRSLDEGFESDPDRISTDSELASAQAAPAFDVLQTTDRDGVQHTQIARRSPDSALAKDSGPESIICLDGEIENELRSKLEKTTLGRPPTGLQNFGQQKINTGQSHQIRYRRVKTRAPPPPLGSYYYQKRSQSVDSMSRSQLPNAQYGSMEPAIGMSGAHLDMVNSNGDVLAGRFVRVSVNAHHHQQHQLLNHPYRMSSLSTNNIYKYCHASTAMTGHHHQQQQQQHQHLMHHHHGSTGAGGNSSGASSRNNLYSLPSHYHGGLSAASVQSTSHQTPSAAAVSSVTGRNYKHFNHVPVCWTQSIPRQTRR